MWIVSRKILSLRTMRRLEHNLLTRMVLMLCVVMQSVLLIPHHHHSSTGAACLDFFHLYAIQDCRTACTDPQPAADGSTEECATDRFIITAPVAREHVTEVAWHEHDSGCGCPLCSPDARLDLSARITAIALVESETLAAEHIPYLREYFTDALPSRAPACVAVC